MEWVKKQLSDESLYYFNVMTGVTQERPPTEDLHANTSNGSSIPPPSRGRPAHTFQVLRVLMPRREHSRLGTLKHLIKSDINHKKQLYCKTSFVTDELYAAKMLERPEHGAPICKIQARY